jgi:hypothetical protein
MGIASLTFLKSLGVWGSEICSDGMIALGFAPMLEVSSADFSLLLRI